MRYSNCVSRLGFLALLDPGSCAKTTKAILPGAGRVAGTGNAVSALHDTIPLLHAVLCVDCEVISATALSACPTCGGSALLNLSFVLGGSIGQPFGHAMPIGESSMKKAGAGHRHRVAVIERDHMPRRKSM